MHQFNIDPAFSVYKLVKRSIDDTAVLNHRRTMSIISNEIENVTLIDHAETIMFSSFQRFSKFIPQISRYRQIASKARAVYVFGIPDVSLPPIDNVVYVPLQPNDQLVREWFIVSFGRDYFSALATEELSNFDDPDPLRVFKGIWTFDANIVAILNEWLAGTVGMRTEQVNVIEPDYTRQARNMKVMMQRLEMRINNTPATSAHNVEIQRELKNLLRGNVQPSLQHIEQIQNNGGANGLNNPFNQRSQHVI